MVHGLVNQWFKEIKDHNYMTWLTTAVVIVFIFFGIQRGYQWYNMGYEQKAQLAMSEALEEYDRAFFQMMEEGNSPEVVRQRFEDTHVGFDVILNSYGNSKLIPCAQGFEATAFWYSDKKDDALSVMDKAISGSKKSPLFYSLKTKKALMTLESGSVQEGLDQLSELSHNSKNPQADTAAFYLGYYYWSQKDSENAKKAWQILEKYGEGSVKNKRGVSPWLAVAREKMNLIAS